MENKAKAGATICIMLVIIVIVYLYLQVWFTQVTPYFEKFIRVISNL